MPPPKQRLRQCFHPHQDYLLVVQVNKDEPFRAPNGGLMANWEKIATTLNNNIAFKMHHLKGPIVKSRFERLVTRFRTWIKNGSRPDEVPSHDTAFQDVMMELLPKLDAAEAEPQTQTLGKRGRPRKIRNESEVVPVEKKRPVLATPVVINPSPSTSSSSTALVADPKPLPVGFKSTRQRFSSQDDLLLVRYVKELLPFHAKFGAISAAWEDIATKLDKNPNFSKDAVKGPVVRYRFENLVAKYRKRVKHNNGCVVGPKGAPAGELEELMTELVTLLDSADKVRQNVAIATNAIDSTSTVTEPVAITSVNKTDRASIAELKDLLHEIVEQQKRSTKEIVLLHQEERRLEQERRVQERLHESQEREKDRQALTNTVMSAMKTFLHNCNNSANI